MTYRRIVNTANGTIEIGMSVSNSVSSVTATNNKAEYYANQAKSYRDEAQTLKEELQDYIENNPSLVTSEQLEEAVGELEDSIDELDDKIDLKQDAGNYALASAIPQKVSDLTNDSGFISSVPIATASTTGVVKPDGTTITIDSAGTITAAGGGGGSSSSIDSVTVAEYAFPSKTYYKDLTFAQSGTSFTATATGWVMLQRKGLQPGEYLALTNTSCKNIAMACVAASSSSFTLRTYIPVSKNDNFKINFSATGATDYFRFIYARGCESEADNYQQS